MEPRYLLPGLLACALSCAAFATEETDAQQATVDNAPETMEHVEAVGYPVPAITQDADETDRRLVAEQFREQSRQELLREHNRRALMDSVHNIQQQQLEAFRTAGESQNSEEETAEVVTTAPTQQPSEDVVQEPLNLQQPAALTIEPVADGEEEATAIEPAQEMQQAEEAPQEPS
ncbi:hypothetical protein JF535_01415 [Microbulbifer salipaludis]|uniref:Uncharacterized protein n=1 Tax=Microbulbifer salipaludis TaxID=187980 RepID=A0ABS3E2H6_9GAMM|nr:hypothetical protein [Microbulbifer salipaludis]MBN8429498.1 hypothetical protein [Microbulbifer salipaludis]